MTKPARPGVNHALAPAHGVSRDGQALSYNRAPAPDLAPWIARLYATKIRAAGDYCLHCSILNDTSMVRVQLAGEWTAETATGKGTYGRVAMFMGPHRRRMPVTVTGSFTSMGYSLRPGAVTTLKGPRIADFLDRIAVSTEIGPPADWLLARLDDDAHPEEWLTVLEEGVRQWIAHHGSGLPDPITTRFETAAFTDPTISVAAIARECDVGERTLERIVLRDFGLPPKQVLRRARALDMASHLRGVADQGEAEELVLRYYDQSHLIREFTDLFGMSPGQFVATPQPLMTLSLELRQARRLDALERIGKGTSLPWQAHQSSVEQA